MEITVSREALSQIYYPIRSIRLSFERRTWQFYHHKDVLVLRTSQQKSTWTIKHDVTCKITLPCVSDGDYAIALSAYSLLTMLRRVRYCIADTITIRDQDGGVVVDHGGATPFGLATYPYDFYAQTLDLPNLTPTTEVTVNGQRLRKASLAILGVFPLVFEPLRYNHAILWPHQGNALLSMSNGRCLLTAPLGAAKFPARLPILREALVVVNHSPEGTATFSAAGDQYMLSLDATPNVALGWSLSQYQPYYPEYYYPLEERMQIHCEADVDLSDLKSALDPLVDRVWEEEVPPTTVEFAPDQLILTSEAGVKTTVSAKRTTQNGGSLTVNPCYLNHLANIPIASAAIGIAWHETKRKNYLFVKGGGFEGVLAPIE